MPKLGHAFCGASQIEGQEVILAVFVGKTHGPAVVALLGIDGTALLIVIGPHPPHLGEEPAGSDADLALAAAKLAGGGTAVVVAEFGVSLKSLTAWDQSPRKPVI